MNNKYVQIHIKARAICLCLYTCGISSQKETKHHSSTYIKEEIKSGYIYVYDMDIHTYDV